MKSTLHNTIMRRVYYAYVIRLLATPGVMHGFLMLATLIALTYFVSLGNVFKNLLNIPVRDVGTFFYNAVTNTEAWTLLLLGCFIFAALSLRFKIASTSVPHSYANT